MRLRDPRIKNRQAAVVDSWEAIGSNRGHPPTEERSRPVADTHRHRWALLQTGPSPGHPPTSPGPRRTCGEGLTRPADTQDGNTTKGPGRNSRERLTDEQRDELRRWNLQNRWSPNQLRHTAATQVRKLAGLETARAVLGHSTSAVTEQYEAEVDLEKAASVIQRIG